MVYKMRVGQGGREGGLRQEFVGVLLGEGGGVGGLLPRGKMLPNIQRF